MGGGGHQSGVSVRIQRGGHIMKVSYVKAKVEPLVDIPRSRDGYKTGGRPTAPPPPLPMIYKNAGTQNPNRHSGGGGPGPQNSEQEQLVFLPSAR